MTTGELIQARRKEAGMTQAELGKKLGISGAGIAQWENNLRKPKKETLSRIASALNISIPDIPDEQEERLLLRLRNGRIVHDGADGKDKLRGAEQRATVGANIRKVRKQQGLSMAELGGRIGITAAALSRYELGQRKIGIKTLLRIADALNVNPLSLYPEDERTDAVIPYLAADSNALQRVTSALEEFQYDASEIPDEPDEKILARLRSGRIVHTENTAFWRDAVGMYGSPTCSECGGSAAVKTRFCPHCGARMGNFVVERVCSTYRGIDMTAIEYNDIPDYPPEIAALAKAAEPLRDYLLERGDPHSCVVVTQYGATLKRDEIGIPFAKAKCMSDDDFTREVSRDATEDLL